MRSRALGRVRGARSHGTCTGPPRMKRNGGDLPVDARASAERPSSRLQNTKIESKALQLRWHQHSAGNWCLLNEVDVNTLGSGYGVFVIWRNGGAAKMSAVLYVGRGSLRSELAERRRSPLFTAARLRVTWAEVEDARDLDGVATYLYQQLRPMWGEIMSSANPRPVNLPLTA